MNSDYNILKSLAQNKKPVKQSTNLFKYMASSSKKIVGATKALCKKGQKRNTEIEHKIFLECSEVTEDKFWKDILLKAAYGKFPRSFTYINGFLYYKCSNSNNKKKVELPDSPIEGSLVAMQFFKEHGGIYSEDDDVKIMKYNNMIKEQEMNRIVEWKDIKKIKVRDMLILNYIEKISKEYDFDDFKKKELETTINIGFILRYFDTKDVMFNDGAVTGINGLIYDKKEGNFIIDPKLQPLRIKNIKKIQAPGLYTTESNDIKVTIDKSWTKYLNHLRKCVPISSKNSQKIKVDTIPNEHKDQSKQSTDDFKDESKDEYESKDESIDTSNDYT